MVPPVIRSALIALASTALTLLMTSAFTSAHLIAAAGLAA